MIEKREAVVYYSTHANKRFFTKEAAIKARSKL